MLGKASGGFLGENQPAIDLDVKNSSVTGDQFGFQVRHLPDLIRQTGGSGKVVSLHAVLDRDLHLLSCSAIIGAS
jgi:hypothetical protein